MVKISLLCDGFFSAVGQVNYRMIIYATCKCQYRAATVQYTADS